MSEFVVRSVPCEKCGGTGREPLRNPTGGKAVTYRRADHPCPVCHEGRVPDPRDVEAMARAMWEFACESGDWIEHGRGGRQEMYRHWARVGLSALMRRPG